MIIIFFIFGLFVGSFLGVLLHRLQKKEKGILWGRSHCDNCHKVLRCFELIPVFSWVFLKGKCSKCQQKISIKHPLRELLTGILLALTAFLTPLNQEADLVLLFWRVFIIIILWAITLYDLDVMEIPDQISLPAILILFLFSAFLSFKNINISHIPLISEAFLGLSIALIFFLLQVLVSLFFKRDFVGGGDLRLAAIMGIVLGWKVVIIALFLAYFIGSAFIPFIMMFKKKGFGLEIPFGPFLSLATFISLFWGKDILNFWLNLTGLI